MLRKIKTNESLIKLTTKSVLDYKELAISTKISNDMVLATPGFSNQGKLQYPFAKVTIDNENNFSLDLQTWFMSISVNRFFVFRDGFYISIDIGYGEIYDIEKHKTEIINFVSSFYKAGYILTPANRKFLGCKLIFTIFNN